MEIGMLWFDDTKRELDQKVARAVEHYKNKYGASPTVCFVNPAAFAKDAEPVLVGGDQVHIRPARTVMLHHFWVGVDEAFQPAGQNGKAARRSANGANGGNGAHRPARNGSRRKK